MWFAAAILVGLSPATVIPAQSPWLIGPSSRYEKCIFDAIDRQYATKRFSEKAVLSQCAKNRRTQVREAKVALARLGGGSNEQALIARKFVSLDQQVWTIVGHLRARRESRAIGS